MRIFFPYIKQRPVKPSGRFIWGIWNDLGHLICWPSKYEGKEQVEFVNLDEYQYDT